MTLWWLLFYNIIKKYYSTKEVRMDSKQSNNPNRSGSLFEKLLSGDQQYTTAEIIEMIRAENREKQRAKEKRVEQEQPKPMRSSLEIRLQQERELKLAKINHIKSMELPLDFENVFDNDERAQGIRVDNVADGLIKCLHELGRVDIEYIATISQKDMKTVITSLRGSIYQNPDSWNECFYKGWETADEYLSGNLMKKLKKARRANEEYIGWFENNVSALQDILHKPLATEDIYVSLGSPWLPADIVDDFIQYLLGKPFKYISVESRVQHDELTGTWEIPYKSRYSMSADSYSKYGTRRIEALHIIERTLNMRDVAIFDEVEDPKDPSKTRKVLNEAETILAIEKQKIIIDKFQKWVWIDEQRKERLQAIYEDKFAYYRTRKFDGSFLEFPGMSKDVELFQYQKNSVARIIFTPNTLLAHDVGSGKTYVMVAAGMELKRIGLSKKNLYVVPNNILGQWKAIYLEMYPQANIFCVEPKNFTPTKKRATLEYIRDHEFDGIIMAYSCFDRIPLSKEYINQRLREEQKKLDGLSREDGKDTSGLRKARQAIKREIEKLQEKQEKLDSTIAFDKLGITRLFVDEAHNYKNVPIDTKINRVRGISNIGSTKCEEMLSKVQYIQRRNNGAGVVMATGTPITNSITDAFVMQKYLQEGELALLELQNFDSWVGMFAERSSEFEIDVDTNTYRLATRLSKFHNLPELTSLLSSIADFHSKDNGADLPKFNGHHDILVGKTEALQAYLQQISERAENVHKGKIPRTEDNMLKITTDGRKAALDIRLVEKKAGFYMQSKVYQCAERVITTYLATREKKSTQLVFCDSSTPKAEFNMYDELCRLLILGGIPRNEIAYIHDVNTEKQREALFARINDGEVAVLIGSTFKLGLGVNVQNRLLAVHHLDVPWRPADMVQREGRIIRQGNTNEEVFIYRYITEGSFDAYSWQLLEMKQRFITAILSGSLIEREGSDIEDTVLDYAEVKALAVGNELIKKRVETANELSRYQALQRKTLEAKENLRKELADIPVKQSFYHDLIEKAKKDKAFYDGNKQEIDKEQRKRMRSFIFNTACKNLMNNREETLLRYQGFEIILPAGMRYEDAYVWLKREGKYQVSLGDNEKGTLIRIDNCLENLSNRISKWYLALAELRRREELIQAELDKDENYADEIKGLQEKLLQIDKELGVKQ